MAINLQDHLFIVLSHPNTIRSENATIDCILKLKQIKIDILLSTHYPISNKLCNLVDYYIFDKNNPVVTANDYENLNICNYVFYEDQTYYSEFVKPAVYDYAVFTLIRNGFFLARSLNKKFLHIINYDCLIDVEKYIEQFIKPLESYDLCYTIWDKTITDLMATYLFSFKIDSFSKFFHSISSIADYFNNKQFGWQLEKLTWQYVRDQQLNIYNVDYPHNELNQLSINDVHLFENIFLSVDKNKNLYLFIKNYPNNVIKFNILYQGYNKFHIINPKDCFFVCVGKFVSEEILQIFYKGSLIYSFKIPDNFDVFYKTNKTQIKNSKIEHLLKNSYDLGMSQNKGELIEFVSWLEDKNIKNIMEIGTDKGGNFYLLSSLENTGIKISIDLPHQTYGKQDFDLQKRNEILNQIPGSIHLLNGDSHDQNIYNKTKEILNDQKLDLLFIDGDHTYEGVKQDYNQYKKFVKHNGYVAFHDIIYSINHQSQSVGVSYFWKELVGDKIEFKSHTFWGGIGVIKHDENFALNSNTKETEEIININFIKGAFCEILNNNTNQYLVIFSEDNKTIHQSEINNNCYTKAFRQYFTDYSIDVFNVSHSQHIFTHKFNATNKRVYIHVDSKSLGDNIAWMPYVREFKNKHNCDLVCSTFWNNLFEKEYGDIEFVTPGTNVSNLYAMYEIGIFNEKFKEPHDYRKIPLQQIASNILGLEYKEIKPKIYIQKNESYKRNTVKLVGISTNSTCQAKFWNFNGGWQKVIDFLILRGFTPVLLQLEDSDLKNIIKPNCTNIQDTISWLTKCQFYIGISSGCSWLAWALNIPVIMISGFTKPFNEFQCIRVKPDNNICNGCWHEYIWDDKARGDWNWCPKYKGTNKQFECTKTITSKDIIQTLETNNLV